MRAGDGEDGPGQPDAAAIRVRGVMTTVSTDYEALFRDVFPRLVSLGAVMTGRRDVAHDLQQLAGQRHFFG